MIAPIWSLFHTASLYSQIYFRLNISYAALIPILSIRANHQSPPKLLVGYNFVCGSHKGSSLNGRNKLASSLHLFNALFASIGAELSDIPSNIVHALVIEELRDGRQPKSVAVPEHVFVDD